MMADQAEWMEEMEEALAQGLERDRRIIDLPLAVSNLNRVNSERIAELRAMVSLLMDAHDSDAGMN